MTSKVDHPPMMASWVTRTPPPHPWPADHQPQTPSLIWGLPGKPGTPGSRRPAPLWVSHQVQNGPGQIYHAMRRELMGEQVGTGEPQLQLCCRDLPDVASPMPVHGLFAWLGQAGGNLPGLNCPVRHADQQQKRLKRHLHQPQRLRPEETSCAGQSALLRVPERQSALEWHQIWRQGTGNLTQDGSAWLLTNPRHLARRAMAAALKQAPGPSGCRGQTSSHRSRLRPQGQHEARRGSS